MRTVIKSHKSKRGVTLVELLISIAVLSTLSAIAIFAATNLSGATKKQKLMADVATLNSALRVYQANGGDLSGVTNAAGALTRMKSVATNWKEIAGLRESMVDPRLTVETVSGGSDVRAVWDADTLRFKIATSGDGVKAFVIGDTAESVAAEDRTANLELAKRDTWVWDYADHENEGRGGPKLPGGPVSPGPPVDTSGALPLTPPEISKVGGAYRLKDFDLEVFLRDPNSSEISTIMVSTETDVWREYYGGPLKMSIDGNVKAYARSKDPENWLDSDIIDHTYTVEMIVLDLVLDFEKPNYNYVELGGPIMPPFSAGGTVVADPVLAAPGRALITNVDLLPLSYQNSDTFKVMWTYDNVDPVGAPGEHVSPDFTGGFVPVEIPLDLALFTIQPELPIKATTISPVYPYITSSGIVKAKLEIEKITLRQPLAPVLSGGYLAAQQVVLDFDTSGADMPVGARIYYTLDGSDPGVDTDGEPLTGVEYTGAFSISTSKKLNARVYAPKDYTDWFEPSELYESRLVVPGSEDLYVGGDMSMGSMRGIIRLTPGGTMDATFNPGTGVGEGSYVNSVLMHNAASGVLVGGNFETMNGNTRYGITRLNYNGSVDLSFDAQLE